MEGKSWIELLQWPLWGLCMFIVMGWLGRSRFRARPGSEARRLVQPLSVLIIGAVGFTFFAGIAVISNVMSNETTTWWTTSVFVGFALFCLMIVYAYFMESHEVSEAGLDYRSFAGVRKYLRWSELRAVHYAPAMKWFRLETRSGSVARISIMMMGLPEFARVLLESAPQAAIDTQTLDVLQATAAGHPPSVWT